MKRQVKYRFLLDKNQKVMGIAYSGYEEEIPNNGITYFIYGRLEGTYAIHKPIEKLNTKAANKYGFDDSYKWDALKSYEASGSEDELTPDDIIEEQWKKEYEIEESYQRKTA